MSRRFNTGMLAAALAVLVAMPIASGKASHSLDETGVLDGTSEKLRFELIASLGVSRARLQVKVVVEDGHVRWTLVDPQGQVHMIGRNDGGNVSTDTGKIQEPEPGTWVLELQVGDASGRFWVNWDAS